MDFQSNIIRLKEKNFKILRKYFNFVQRINHKEV